MVQFLKTGISSELKAIEKIRNFSVKSFGRGGFFLPLSQLKKCPELKKKGAKLFGEKDFQLADQALDFAKQNLKAKKYSFLILDEISLALHFGLIDKRDFLKFLKQYGKTKDIVLTGRYCPKAIMEIADLITEFKSKKHYYKKGEKPREGIEY